MSTVLLVALAACMPDIGDDPPPAAAMEFDPTTGRVQEPTVLVIDPATGLVDLSLAGIDVPADCGTLPANAVADCELNRFLESLDGFPPTGTTLRAPADAALDPATLTPANVVLVDATRGKVVPDVAATFDAAGRYVVLTPRAPLPTGTLYVGAVRGYEEGVRAADGGRVTGTAITALLKARDPLTCGAADAASIPATCPALTLLVQQMPEPDARASLVDLEAVRARLVALKAWDAMKTAGGIPPDQAASLWAFPTHSAPVIDIDPATGVLPAVEGTDTIRLAVNGAVDPATVGAWTFDAPGSVFLLDLTALAADDLVGGVPPFTASLAEGVLTLKADEALPDGHTIAILVTTDVKAPGGKSLVPPPMTVLLKARGPLADDQGRSLVTGIPDADAAALEAGRKDFAMLLDDDLFASLTGLERDSLAYVYAFDFPDPTGGAR